jgi:hypothetical protein
MIGWVEATLSGGQENQHSVNILGGFGHHTFTFFHFPDRNLRKTTAALT